MLSQEKEGQCSGAGMAADHGANGVQHKMPRAGDLLHDGLELFGILQAVAVRSEERRVGKECRL